jgi:hypothetical protein
MEIDKALDFLPLGWLFLVTFLLVLLSIESGYRLGRYRHKCSKEEKESPVGSMVGATLGLLAFLLAFTFGLAATRFDNRKQLLLDEANAIGTAYLRAGLLPEGGQEVRILLREYVDVRLDSMRLGKVEEGIRRSEQLHGQIWGHAEALAKKDSGSIIVGLFIQSLNDLIDLHSKRVAAAFYNRIPGAIWAALYTIAALAFAAMGYHGGLAGTTRSLATLAVAFTFSVVMLLIADLDRPLEGSLKVSQSPMVDLRNSMKEAK